MYTSVILNYSIDTHENHGLSKSKLIGFKYASEIWKQLINEKLSKHTLPRILSKH